MICIRVSEKDRIRNIAKECTVTLFTFQLFT